jgi:DNA-binding transcriptional ArsR family regulator
MKSASKLAQLFQALADPTRLGILDLLRGGELCATELNGALDMSQPRVARHLRILVDVGLLAARRDARFVRYSLAPAGDAGRIAAAALESLATVERIRPEGHRPEVVDVSSRRGATPVAPDTEPEEAPNDRPGDIEDFLL